MHSILNKEEIKKLILEKNLIENYINLDKQLTSNGFDLTVEKIFEFTSLGKLDFSNKEREVSQTKEITPIKKNPEDKYGWWRLKKGTYKIRTNEIINLPSNYVALCFSRTSLLRMGSYTLHGVWDAGFRGKGEFILVVENEFGLEIKENARIAQLVFFETKETEPYQGIYKNLK
jgi:dUTP pyrophosphatase